MRISLYALLSTIARPWGRQMQGISVVIIVFVLQEEFGLVHGPKTWPLLQASRRAKQLASTESPANGGIGGHGTGKKSHQGTASLGPTISLLEPDIMASLAINAAASRKLYSFSVGAAIKRLRKNAYHNVGYAAATSTLDRPLLKKKGTQGPARRLIQPEYTERVAAPRTIDNGGREWRSDYAQGYLYLPGVGDAVGGYMLGRVFIKHLYNLTNTEPGNQTCCPDATDNPNVPWYLGAYIPYRYRHPYMEELMKNVTAVQTTEQANVVPTNRRTDTAAPPIDLCVLERWNRELPFSELPNMLLTFLANDDISGHNMAGKAQFCSNLLEMARQAYVDRDPIEDNIFDVYEKFGKLSICRGPDTQANIATNAPAVVRSPTTPTTSKPPPWYAMALAQWSDIVDSGDKSICALAGVQKPAGCDNYAALITDKDPFQIAMDFLRRLYSPSGKNGDRMLKELVSSAKACYKRDSPDSPVSKDGGSGARPDSSSLMGCLDFSLGTGQVRNLTRPASIFASEEICQRFLTPKLDKCAPEGARLGCGEDDIINLNVFARNYYLCIEPVAQSIYLRVSDRKSTAYRDAYTRSPLSSSSVPGAKGAAFYITGTAFWTTCILLVIHGMTIRD